MSELWYSTTESVKAYKDLRSRLDNALAQAVANPGKVNCKSFRSAAGLPTAPRSQVQPMAFRDDDEDDRDPEDREDYGPYADRMGDYLIARHPSGLATLTIQGSLVHKFEWFHPYLPDYLTSYEAIRDAAAILAEDSSVKRVVAVFASGGGMVTGVDEAGQAMKKLAEQKDVIGFTETYSYSASYWLMASLPEIALPRMAQVGSIGTMMVHTSVAKAGEMQGLKWTVLQAGQFKATGNMYEDLDEASTAHLQSQLEEANEFFLSHVAQNRGISLGSQDKWAEGRVFYAQNAIKVGLADRVTTAEQLLQAEIARLYQSNATGGFSMKISQKKLDMIAAGQDPKEVLSESEYAEWQAQTSAPEPAASAPEGGETGEGEDTEPTEPPAEPGTTAYAPAGHFQMSTSDYRQIMRDQAKLEARVEDLQAKLAERDETITAQGKSIEAIMPAASEGIQMLARITGSKERIPSKPDEMATHFTALQERRATIFSMGQASTETTTTEPEITGGGQTSDPEALQRQARIRGLNTKR